MSTLFILATIGLLLGILIGGFFKIYALLGFCLYAAAGAFFIGSAMVAHRGFGQIGSIAETVGLGYLALIAMLQVGYFAGYALFNVLLPSNAMRPRLHR